MKIAHVVIATPGKCGLYESAREIASGLRQMRVDARIVDPKPFKQFSPKGNEDRGVPLADMDWANTADIILNHSGFDGTPIDRMTNPVIHAAHGRPLASHMSYRSGKGANINGYYLTRDRDPRFRAVITFWPEYMPYLVNLWRHTKVYTVNAPVDLDFWKPESTKRYGFNGKSGMPNIVIADAWRSDSDPFLMVHAFMVFSRSFNKAKLHIYGVPKDRKGFDDLFGILNKSGNLGEVLPWVRGLENVYRAADMVITHHKINTRVIREAMACGCQVVSGKNCEPENLNGFAYAMGKRITEPMNTRSLAVRMFDKSKTVSQILEIADSVLKEAAVGN